MTTTIDEPDTSRQVPPTGPTGPALALALVEPLLAAFMTWCALLSWRGLTDDTGVLSTSLALAGVLVVVVGWVLRQVSGNWWVVLPVQAVVVWLWLQHRVTGSWLPGPSEIETFLAWLASGAEAGQRYVSPVPADQPTFVFLLVASGTGLLLLVDFLACTLRRAPLAGLPLLLVITISASLLLQPLTVAIFAGAALAWLALMAWQESLLVRDWAAAARGSATQSGDQGGDHSPSLGGALGRSLGSMTLRIGLVCALVAVVPTGLLPSQGRQLGSIGQGPGAGSIITTNPLLDMRRNLELGSDVPLVSVRTQRGTPTYLRTTVLDVFTGAQWQPGDRTYGNTGALDGSLPPAPGVDVANRGTSRAWSIQVGTNFPTPWLPLPYPAEEVDVSGGWRYDAETLDVVATGATTAAGRGYRAQTVPVKVDPSSVRIAGDPPASVRDAMTRLPDRLPDVFRATAERVTAGADNDFDKAVALQNWFRTNGTYDTLPAAGNGIGTLERFISGGSDFMVGYCEQFSTAMAVMARTLGIPARVATGFLRGERQGNQWVFTARDLHAWPELYFRGVGWIRFEPTPGQRTQAAPSYTRDQGSDQPQEAPTVTQAPSDLPSQAAPTQRPDVTADTTADQGSSPLRWAIPLVLLLLAGLLAAGPRAARGWVTRRRWARAENAEQMAEAAWDEVRDTARDLELDWDPDASVRDNRRRLRDQVSTTPEADEALDDVVRYIETARYAPHPGGTTLVEAPRPVRAEVEAWQRAVTASVGPRRARRARWFPRSLVTR